MVALINVSMDNDQHSPIGVGRRNVHSTHALDSAFATNKS